LATSLLKKNIDFDWIDSANSSVNCYRGAANCSYNFSFVPAVQGNYTLRVFTKDKNSTANVKLFYSIQVLGESDFEALRIALMNDYNSQTTTHVGYIVALLVGIATIFLKSDFFTAKRSRRDSLALIFALVFLICLLFYCSLRLSYWSALASRIKVVTVADIDYTRNRTMITAMEGAAIESFENIVRSSIGLESLSLFFKDLGLIYSTLLFLLVCALFDLIIWKFLDWRQKSKQTVSNNPCLF